MERCPGRRGTSRAPGNGSDTLGMFFPLMALPLQLEGLFQGKVSRANCRDFLAGPEQRCASSRKLPGPAPLLPAQRLISSRPPARGWQERSFRSLYQGPEV